jgi:hypothetical protein
VEETTKRLSLDAHRILLAAASAARGLGRAKNVVFGPSVSFCKLFQGDDVGSEVGGSTWITEAGYDVLWIGLGKDAGERGLEVLLICPCVSCV